MKRIVSTQTGTIRNVFSKHTYLELKRHLMATQTYVTLISWQSEFNWVRFFKKNTNVHLRLILFIENLLSLQKVQSKSKERKKQK